MRLIDADALPLEPYGEDVISWYATGWNDAINVINRAPTVDAEPVRHGVWPDKSMYTICTACGKVFCDNLFWVTGDYIVPSYCPNCGAKMDGCG